MYRTGITVIDNEHERLFEIIRETNDVIKAEFLHDKYDKIVDILDELMDFLLNWLINHILKMDKQIPVKK